MNGATERVGTAELLPAAEAGGGEGEAAAAAGGGGITAGELVRAAVHELLQPADPLGSPEVPLARREHSHSQRSDGSDAPAAEAEAVSRQVSVSELGSSLQGEDGAPRGAPSVRGDSALSLAARTASPRGGAGRRLTAAAVVKNALGGAGGGGGGGGGGVGRQGRGSVSCGMPAALSGHGSALAPAAAPTPDALAASAQTRLSAQLRAAIRGEGRIGVWERMGSVPLDAQAEVDAWLRLPLQLVAQIRVRVRITETVTVTVTVTLP